MAQVKRFRVLGFIAAAALLCSGLAAQISNLDAIQTQLNAQFRLTTTTADRSDIVTAGDVVVIHKSGLVMFSVTTPLPPTNTYKNGIIEQGFGTALMKTGKDTQQRRFVPEEKFWVTGIQIKQDGVLFQLISDPYYDIRYYANLKIPFPNKKEVPPADAFLQTVAEVLTVVPSDDQGVQQVAEPPSRQAPSRPAPPMPARAPYRPAPSRPVHTPTLSNSSPSGLDGDWRNVDPKTRSIVEIIIEGNVIHPYGACHPNACDMGMISAQSFASNVQSSDISKLVAKKNQGFNRIEISLSLEPDGRLRAEKLTHFTDQSGRADYSTVDYFTNVTTPEAAIPTPEAAPPPPTPMPDIAPPPPPADTPPPTIALGQKKDDVTANFGQPTRIVKLGVKEIYYYKDMKVTFTNGKVSNVE